MQVTCKYVPLHLVNDGSPDIDIDERLKGQGLRVTSARRAIYMLLHQGPDPMSAAQIVASLHQAAVAIDLVTVYRTLETLERCGLVARVDRMPEGWRYAVRSKHHAHTIVCSDCGGASPLDICDLQRMERSLERATGFTNISHSLQFFGTCPSCRK